jgi:hypothetical protein
MDREPICRFFAFAELSGIGSGLTYGYSCPLLPAPTNFSLLPELQPGHALCPGSARGN